MKCFVLTVCLLTVAATAVFVAFNRPGVQASPAVTIGVDADPGGNTATSLGTTESCVSVGIGDTFEIDVYIVGVEDLQVWHVFFRYHPSVVNVVERDVQMFLAADPGSDVNDHSYGDPALGGAYDLLVADIADDPPHESGSGVLVRLTLRAVGPGLSQAALEDPVFFGYPLHTISIDAIHSASIVVDGPCPGDPPPRSDEDNDGFTDDQELRIGTDPLDDCPDNMSDDAWPLDIDMDTWADVGDILMFKPVIMNPVPPGPARYDLAPDQFIDVGDILMFKPVIMTQCAQ